MEFSNDNIPVAQIEAPAVVQRDTTRGEAVNLRIKQIAGSVQLATFELAALLSEQKKNDYWALAGYESWEDSIKQSDLDLSPRQAYYLVQINDLSEQLGITMEERRAAKISKLKEIYTLDPNATYFDEAEQKEVKMADEIINLVKIAPHRSLAEIKEIVKRLKGASVDSPDDELTWLNLPIRRDAKQVVHRAIDLAKLLSGNTIDAVTEEVKNISDAMALERICGDFLADPNNVADEMGEAGDHQDEFVADEEPAELGYDEPTATFEDLLTTTAFEDEMVEEV